MLFAFYSWDVKMCLTCVKDSYANIIYAKHITMLCQTHNVFGLLGCFYKFHKICKNLRYETECLDAYY